jgi:hypothetical protein
MTIEKDPIRGCYIITDIHEGQLVNRQYFGYTKSQALRLFKQFIKESTHD